MTHPQPTTQPQPADTVESVPYFKPSIGEEEIAAVAEVLRSGWLTTGPRTKQFEEAFADYIGVPHAVAVNSCTAALHLALEAVGVERGDYVLVPTLTFAATAEVVRYFDAVPVLVDCDPATLCMDVAQARQTLEAIRNGLPVAGLEAPHGAVKAIVPVHFTGTIADVEGIARLAEEFGLAVIEDAAHTLPAYWREAGSEGPWRMVGDTAKITCFSFYANKCITTGEGGMIVTHDAALAERMRMMSLHGLSRDAWKRFAAGGSWKYDIIAPGYKYNLTDLQSAVGIHQLAKVDTFYAARRRVVEGYAERLAALSDVVELPTEAPDRQCSWHLYIIRLRHDRLAIHRDEVINQLKAAGIGTGVHYQPLHLHSYYQGRPGAMGAYPVATAEWERFISLPIFPDLTDAQLDRITDVLATICGARAGS